jgi:hypothetical protein
MQELRGIIPARWVLPLNPSKVEQEVLLNWLDVELPASSAVAERAAKLSLWRNREVFWFIRGWDWTARMYGA